MFLTRVLIPVSLLGERGELWAQEGGGVRVNVVVVGMLACGECLTVLAIFSLTLGYTGG